ncbi:MAG: ammonium transporter [Candidatus Entotheonella factor]|uniref:Ammonium transporter n=1 Tax=Entotheonella factor TaxID=1429438 RepID=W4L5J0_ENTF1|nr:ammonium transporter [Candidatus Entotheonella palauensis]ETW93348.1 MAG: ammonium transporter [Candidatus Entotheonella factor]
MDGTALQLSLNTVWLVMAAALVFFMQAGFAMLEGGMVRSKNTVNVIMKNYVDMCFAGLFFWAVGYGLMYGANPTGWYGTDRFLLHDASNWNYTLLFYQMMFAATAATIVSGAVAERMRYAPYVVSSIFISSFIYAIFGSWAWGSLSGETSGWLKSMGFIDFAGSTVVHSVGGWCALTGVIVLGPRLGRFGHDGESRTIAGHNLPLLALGAFILWVGWFGFNGGSVLEANASLGAVVLNTHLSGVAGVAGTILFLKLLGKPILMTSTINGGLAGLVSITAGAAYMEPPFAILTGFIGGIAMVIATGVFESLKLDDTVGAVAVHGVAGAWGTLAVGLFRTGHLFDVDQILVQVIGIGAALLWSVTTSFVMWKAISMVMGLRVNTLHEQRGLDFSEHYEVSYPEFQQDLLHSGKE